MNVLVDSSVWIDYFRGGRSADAVGRLIDQNALCINDLILAELVPYLHIKKQKPIIRLLYQLTRIEMATDWSKVIDYQIKALEKGINKTGVPDLMILDQVKTNGLILFTLDKHFKLLQKYIHYQLWE